MSAVQIEIVREMRFAQGQARRAMMECASLADVHRWWRIADHARDVLASAGDVDGEQARDIALDLVYA